MWSDFLRFLGRLVGVGPRRISMDPEFEAERLRAARRIRIVVVLVFVGLVGAYFAARPVSRFIKGRHADSLVQKGETLFAAGDLPGAMREMEAAGALSPIRPSVTRLRAKLMTAFQHPGAAEAWAEQVRNSPKDDSLRVEWVIALLRVDQRAAAVEAFREIGDAARTSARGRLAEGLLALGRGETRQAESALREAARLDANDLVTRLELGRLLLSTTSSAEGVQLLTDLRSNPRFHRTATLFLIEHARRQPDLPRALELARELSRSRQAEPADLPRVLDLLVAMKDETALEATLQEALPLMHEDRRGALALLAWLVEQRQHDRALVFLGSLPVEAWTSREFLSVAGLLLTRQPADIARLRELLRRGDWAQQEALRAACSARQAEWERDLTGRRERWSRAEAAAKGDRLQLLVLRRLTREWGWPREQLWVLRELATILPSDQSVLRAWYELAASQRDTGAVADSARALIAAGDESLSVRNDYATASMLLGQDLPRASKIALENFTANPGSIVMTGTYAGSLRLQGRAADALKVLEEATARGLQHPALTFERVLALDALGRRPEAIQIVKDLPAADRLPEHNALLARLLKEAR